MGRPTAVLTQTDHHQPITEETDARFLQLLKLGLLLALREQGILDDLQLRMARERLGGAV